MSMSASFVAAAVAAVAVAVHAGVRATSGSAVRANVLAMPFA